MNFLRINIVIPLTRGKSYIYSLMKKLLNCFYIGYCGCNILSLKIIPYFLYLFTYYRARACLINIHLMRKLFICTFQNVNNNNNIVSKENYSHNTVVVRAYRSPFVNIKRKKKKNTICRNH